MAKNTHGKRTILLFVKSAGNRKVIADCIEDEGYVCKPVLTAEAMQHSLSNTSEPLALVDASGFGNGIWDVCKELQDHAVPFIVLSPRESLPVSSKAAALGAVSILQKPVAKAALVQLLNGFSGQF